MAKHCGVKQGGAKDGGERRSACPITFALDLFGDKWTLLIIRDLAFSGKRHYNDLLASDEHISTNILADRLARLEGAEIVRKSVDPDNKRRFIYRLTDKGLDLIPVLLEIIVWSAKHGAATPEGLARRLKTDRAGVARELRRRAQSD